MNLRKCFSMAFSSIWGSKMRSFLTMLGIIIGIAAVIILVSLMNGLTGQLTGIFEDMGTTTISANIMSRATTKVVKPDEMFALVDENSSILENVSPSVSVNATLKAGNGDDSITASATGVAETYLDMKNLEMQSGRFIQYVDVLKNSKVCVLGTYISNEMFGGKALGQTLKVNGQPYKVVGILTEQEDSSSSSADNCMYIPYTSACKLNGSDTISSYVVTASSEDTVTPAVAKIKELFYKKIGDEDYYSVISMLSMIDKMTSMMDSMKTVLIAIAGISLLVGGIGIMNIMLVSVTERTREIGIRKSLGARHKHIMSQFVIEAGVVSCIGGVFGIILGSAVSVIAGKLLDMAVVPSVFSIILSFSVSAGIGVAFGFLPARKAAALNPIDALKYD